MLWIAGLAGCATTTTEPTDPGPPPSLQERCFPTLGDPSAGPVPVYDDFGLRVPPHCMGTDEQEFSDLDRVVFLGDSITTGTPPTDPGAYYRNQLVTHLQDAYGHPLETQDCSAWGARVDDLMQDNSQMADCLGTEGTDERATLVVFTIGGNDMFEYAQDMLAGGTAEQVHADVDATIDLLDQALDWLVDQKPRFPNGLYVVYGNIYEYTDGTGDLGVCPTAQIFGFDGVIPEMREEYVRADEAWVRLAKEHGFDIVFMLEQFCGHGFLAGDPTNECFRGEDAETWFDGTCIHPTQEGHLQLGQMFATTVLE